MHNFPWPRGLINTEFAWWSPANFGNDVIVVLLLVIKIFPLRNIIKRKRFNFAFAGFFERYGLGKTMFFEYLNNFLTVSH